MKSMRFVVLCLSCVSLVGLAPTYAQDALQTLEQQLEVPLEPPAALMAQAMGYLGMTVDLMKPEGSSFFIVSVVDGGPAAKGGLKANDVILEINGQTIGKERDVLDRLVRQPAGTRLAFKVRRDNVPQRFDVVLGSRSATPAPSVEATVDELPPPVPSAPAPGAAEAGVPAPGTDGGPTVLLGPRPHLGIKVADAERLNDALKRRFGVVVDTGALISEITEGAPAALAGLPVGGVVVSVNGKRIGNAQDIVDLVRTFEPGQQIEVTYWEGDRLGRKTVRVGRSAVAVTPATPEGREDATAAPRTSRGRRSTDRPILNALEQILDDVLPPSREPRSVPGAMPPLPAPDLGAGGSADRPAEGMIPPPPPPRPDATLELPDVNIEPPAADLPEPSPEGEDVEQLRKQAIELQKQLEALLRRIDELEKKKQGTGT